MSLAEMMEATYAELGGLKVPLRRLRELAVEDEETDLPVHLASVQRRRYAPGA